MTLTSKKNSFPQQAKLAAERETTQDNEISPLTWPLDSANRNSRDLTVRAVFASKAEASLPAAGRGARRLAFWVSAVGRNLETVPSSCRLPHHRMLIKP